MSVLASTTEPETEATDAPATAQPERRTPFTRRAILLALVFGFLGIAWVVQNSLIGQSVHVGGSVPPIPAVAVLLLLAAINPLLKRHRLAQGEILLVVLFVGIAAAVADPNCLLTYFFAFLMMARYAPEGTKPFGELLDSIPNHFAPKDQAALRGFAEGHAPIPWNVWAIPLLGWGVFFMAMWFTSYAALRLFRDRWMLEERLAFPIVDMMVQLTPEESNPRSLLRNRLLWAGVACSAALNVLNILSAFYPGIPSPGRHVDVGVAFTELPWKALHPMWISIRPEIFGIGYLMNTDVLFTAWFSYLALRLGSVIGAGMGYEIQSTYYDYQEIASGAYLGILFSLIWMGRGSFANVWRHVRTSLAFLPSSDPRARITRRNRLYAAAGLLGFGYQLWWVTSAGLALWAGALYLALLLGFAIVYSRIRAETGAPIWYVFPFWQQQKLVVNLFGSAALSGGGGTSLAALAMLGFLSRGMFPQLAAFQIESMEVSERAKVRPRHMAACVLAALPFGLLVGGAFFLIHCYHFGFYSLDGGKGEGGFRVMMATQQYREMVGWQSHPTGPNLFYILHTLLGGGIIIALSALRSAFLGCPLHPMGFAMAASYGFHLWAPFLAVWVVKLLILRAGGARLYRQFLPFFIGIVVGHYLVAGIVWGIVSLFLPELTHKFIIHFS